MPDDALDAHLEAIAIEAFRAFDDNPKLWPETIEMNRVGYSDVAIRGLYKFEDRIEFFHVYLDSLDTETGESIGTSPDSSGSAVE